MKKIISVILLYILTIQNVFGSTLILEDKKDNVIYRQYEVNNEENNTFYSQLEENITIDNIQYKKVEYEVGGGNEKDTIEVIDTKWIYVKFLDTFFENFFIFMRPLSSLYYILNLYWYKWYTELLTSLFTPIQI